MRKQTKRKVWARINPIEWARQGACITDKAALDKLSLLELSALEAFAMGRAEPGDWSLLSGMLLLSAQMARAGIGPEALSYCLQAQEAMGAVKARERLLFTGPELQALRHSCEYAHLQRASIARSVFEEQIRLAVIAEREQRAKKAKKTKTEPPLRRIAQTWELASL